MWITAVSNNGLTKRTQVNHIFVWIPTRWTIELFYNSPRAFAQRVKFLCNPLDSFLWDQSMISHFCAAKPSYSTISSRTQEYTLYTMNIRNFSLTSSCSLVYLVTTVSLDRVPVITNDEQGDSQSSVTLQLRVYFSTFSYSKNRGSY